MTWLVIVKVLPPLQIGEPPSYRSVYTAQSGREPQFVAWEMLWNDRKIGYATTSIGQRHGGVTEVRSYVYFRQVPLDELVPLVLRPALRAAVESVGALSMDARSRLEIDPIGRLSRISSRMRVEGHDAEISIDGQVKGTTIKGAVRAGPLVQHFERYLPPDALMGDELSPQAKIPGLRIGQEWTVPVYSPIRFSDNRNPVEVLHARVDGHESVPVGDETVLTLTVTYRTDSGSILGGGQTPRGKLWVAEDGTVLKQTTYLFGSQLITFERASGARAEEILKMAFERAQKFDRQDRERRRYGSRENYPPVGRPAPQQPNRAPSESPGGRDGKPAEPAEHTSKRGADATTAPGEARETR
jgi:hypothetical protein